MVIFRVCGTIQITKPTKREANLSLIFWNDGTSPTRMSMRLVSLFPNTFIYKSLLVRVFSF